MATTIDKINIPGISEAVTSVTWINEQTALSAENFNKMYNDLKTYSTNVKTWTNNLVTSLNNAIAIINTNFANLTMYSDIVEKFNQYELTGFPTTESQIYDEIVFQAGDSELSPKTSVNSN